MLTASVFALLSAAGALASPQGRGDVYGDVRMSAWDAQAPVGSLPVPFYNPADRDGTMFDNTGNGLGEPLNVSSPLSLRSDNASHSSSNRSSYPA